eukprot:1367106-Amorphochlora_amoeboformis.AAC.2
MPYQMSNTTRSEIQIQIPLTVFPTQYPSSGSRHVILNEVDAVVILCCPKLRKALDRTTRSSPSSRQRPLPRCRSHSRHIFQACHMRVDIALDIEVGIEVGVVEGQFGIVIEVEDLGLPHLIP